MNYQLMANGFAPISIAKENRLDYFNALEAYAVEGDILPFAEMIAELEEIQLDRYLAMIEQAQGNEPAVIKTESFRDQGVRCEKHLAFFMQKIRRKNIEEDKYRPARPSGGCACAGISGHDRAPSVVKFNTDHFICGNTFRCVWALREYTKPLFFIPTHQFLFNAGAIDEKFYIDTL